MRLPLNLDTTALKEIGMVLPNLAILTGKLALDKRVSWETKGMLLAGTAYIVSPIDFVPDVIPGLGQVEDLFVAVLLLDGILNEIDPAIVEEHWNGDLATLTRLRVIVNSIMAFVPAFIREQVVRRAFHSPRNPVNAVRKFVPAGR
ncbi:MAG: YkvA family protein [Candidatus Sumerlaeaceae bacterium]